MFRIGEFSQLAQVTVRTLHHYDELGLLKPAQIDRFTDYRYYTVEQLPRLNRILALKDLGFSLDQITRLLKDDMPAEQLRGMLKLKQAEIEQHLQEERLRLQRVAARLRQIEQEGHVSQYEVVLKKVAPLTVATLRQIVPSLGDMKAYRCSMMIDLYHWLAQQSIKKPGTELVLYHLSEYVEQDIDMEIAVEVDAALLHAATPPLSGRITLRELAAVPTMASVIHSGSLYDVGQAIIALYIWIGENGYMPCGPYRELHLFWSELDEHTQFDNITIEMQIPVENDITPKTRDIFA